MPRSPVSEGEAWLNILRLVERHSATQQDAFLNCLTEKLMTYALGRGVNVYDRLYKEAFVEVLRDEEQTLRRLIKEIVKSELFRFN